MLAQDRRFDREAQPQDGPPVTPWLREWRVSAKSRDLEGPNHAARVAQIHRGGARRGDAPQLRDERRESLGDQPRLNRGADVGVPGQLVHRQAAGDGAEVEAGSAGEYRHGAALGNAG